MCGVRSGFGAVRTSMLPNGAAAVDVWLVRCAVGKKKGTRPESSPYGTDAFLTRKERDPKEFSLVDDDSLRYRST